MKDYNGKEIRAGDFVRISGAFFKNSNGVFLVDHTGDADAWLRRVSEKTGKIAESNSAESWPLRSYCSDARKNAEARAHNAEHARIEIAEGVPTWYAAEHFRQKAETARESAERERVNCYGGGRADALEQDAARYDEIAARLAETAEQPKRKEPEKGIRFYWNGVKVDGGKLIPCYIWADDAAETVTISAKHYNDLPREYLPVRNESDLYTDYFDNDRATLTAEHPLYKFARYAALKAIAHRYNVPIAENDPGQPTAADLQAVADMNTAAESARIAAEHAEQLAEREKMLRKRNEGRQFIEQTAAKYPVKDGDPTVEIPFSENPAFYSWTESRDMTRTEITINADGTQDKREIVEQPRRRLILSVAAAEIVLKHFDEDVHAEQRGYDKTDFVIRWTDAETGEPNDYAGRYDLGDNDGGLIAHIRAFGASMHDEQTREQIAQTADYLERFTAGGHVVDVQIAPNVIDFMAEKQKREEARKKQKIQDMLDAVAMLTDEQIEAAVFCTDPNDAEKLDVARFFLQELARRDEARALEVFRRWKNGEGA